MKDQGSFNYLTVSSINIRCALSTVKRFIFKVQWRLWTTPSCMLWCLLIHISTSMICWSTCWCVICFPLLSPPLDILCLSTPLHLDQMLHCLSPLLHLQFHLIGILPLLIWVIKLPQFAKLILTRHRICTTHCNPYLTSYSPSESVLYGDLSEYSLPLLSSTIRKSKMWN